MGDDGHRIMAGTNDGSAMDAQVWYWGAAAGLLLLAVLAGLADRRRHNRARLDDIGWIPWRGVQVAAVFGLLAVLILALKLG